mmetsp:Transcript_30240/g.34465  ORF Transcript_30240/g.34465 Transcript_30240/m.34465 type:complete len:172 (+) Transcript_30240:1-516(+)
MSLKSDYSSVASSAALSTTTSVDLMLSRSSRKQKQQQRLSGLLTIPATPTCAGEFVLNDNKKLLGNNPFATIENGMYFSPMYNVAKQQQYLPSENRVRVASATIIQSAVRRVLTSKRKLLCYHSSVLMKPEYPDKNDDFNRLHHVCAIIIQCHMRSVIAKKIIKKHKKVLI